MTDPARDQLETELSSMSDSEVRLALLAADGMPSNDTADMLAGECERRGIDL